MNQLSKKNIHKILKGSLALAIAGTFTFSTTLAYAADETKNDSSLPVVEMPNTDTSNQTPSQTDIQTQTDSSQPTNETTESPSLLPGSFFYFAKITFEKIKLALTFNKVDEAELLATYAAERLAEAEALIANGDEEKAIETLQKATEYLKNAEDMVTPEQKEPTKEETNPTEEENTTTTSEENVTDVKKDEDESKDKESVVEVNELISQNIIALTAAMNKVKNPKAKAALQKNIDKAYAKLLKKHGKVKEESTVTTVDPKEEQGQSKVDETTTSTPTTESTQVTQTNDDTEKTKEVKTTENTTTVKESNKLSAKAQKDQKKQIKQQAKKAKKETKAQLKEKQEEIKDEKKQQKEIQKQERKKVQEKGNGKSNNGKKQ